MNVKKLLLATILTTFAAGAVAASLPVPNITVTLDPAMMSLIQKGAQGTGYGFSMLGQFYQTTFGSGNQNFQTGAAGKVGDQSSDITHLVNTVTSEVADQLAHNSYGYQYDGLEQFEFQYAANSPTNLHICKTAFFLQPYDKQDYKNIAITIQGHADESCEVVAKTS
jgi:hypothetical protein